METTELESLLRVACDDRMQEFQSWNLTDPAQLANELGRAVARALMKLAQAKSLDPLSTWLKTSNVIVDYNRYAYQPQFTITVEWNYQ